MSRLLMIRRIVPALLIVGLSACVTTGPSGGSPDPREAARVNTELAAGYLGRGRDEAAREKLERALSFDSNYAPAHALYALLLARSGEDDAADARFRTALRISPEDPDTRNNYGAFLCARGRVPAAIEQFDRAAEVRGYVGRVTALTNAGLCLRGTEPARAEAYLRQALEREPENTNALESMAWISYHQAAYMSARAFISRLERVDGLGPESLTIAARTEAALGDHAAARRYRERLAAQYPDYERDNFTPARSADPLP